MSMRSSHSTLHSASTQPPTKVPAQPTTVTVSSTATSKPPNYEPTHHVGNPPTSFKNPWPSCPPPHSLASILKARFFNDTEKNFVPVPADRNLLVPVTTPDWGASDPDSWSKLKATWIGHASFLAEFPSLAPSQRGIRILLDPVFSTRMSPVSFLGPKRFTPPPCTMEELPEVDFVCISHNHYDHLDATTIRFVHQRGKGRVRFLCGLGVGTNLKGMGLSSEDIVEMDWWDGVTINVKQGNVVLGCLKVICTPSQHNSGRSVNDHGATLWCSFVIEEVSEVTAEPIDTQLGGEAVSGVIPEKEQSITRTKKKLFFGGDTAYRSVPQGTTDEELSKLAVCAAFKEVGEIYGSFDLALLPIGCYSPRWWMSAVHCAPEDSVCIHKDIRSRKTIGMHYGTVRGGISQYYEDVTEPPQRWKEACEKAGLKWQDEIGLCGVGETVLV